MLAILNTTATLFIAIFIGMIVGKLGLFKKGDDQKLINYVFYIALPLNLFLACLHAKLAIFNPAYLSSYSLSMIVILVITWLIGKYLFKFTPIERQVSALSTTQVDGAYFTMPLFNLLFKSTALAVPLMFIQNVVFFTLGLILIQFHFEKNKPKQNHLIFALKRTGKVFIHNPVISFAVLGLVFNLLHLKPYTPISNTMKFIGDTSSAVALFSLGLTCSFYLAELKNIANLIKLTTIAVIKLLIFPLIAWLIGRACGLTPELLLALVLLSASPAATHTYIIANKYQVDTSLSTFNVVITTILSFITINVWIYLL